MKRIFSILLCLVLLFSLTACSTPNEETTTPTTVGSGSTTTTSVTTETTVESTVISTTPDVATPTTESFPTTAVQTVTTVGSTLTSTTSAIAATTAVQTETTTMNRITTTTTKVTTTTTTTATTTTVAVNPTYASGLYIDTAAGSDANDGTASAPLKSLSAAINKVNALGLTGNARVITFVNCDWNGISFWLKNQCNSYTENITLTCNTPGRTIWSSADLWMVGPLTINAKFANSTSQKGLQVTTNGHAITFGELAFDQKATGAYPLTVDGVARNENGTTSSQILTVVCVGDSITRNGYWENNMQGLLPTDQYLVKGYGVNSSTAMSTGVNGQGQEMAYTKKNAYQLSLNTNPDIVIIMLGTNDAFNFNWDQACNANAAQFKTDYKALISAYQNLPSHPTVFMALPPTSFYSGGNCSQNLHDKVVPTLREIAAETGLTLIDVHTPTADAQAHFSDGLHPSDDTGRLLIATQMANAVKNYVDNL